MCLEFHVASEHGVFEEFSEHRLLAGAEAFAVLSDLYEDVFVFLGHPDLCFVSLEFVVETCFGRVAFEDVDDFAEFDVVHLDLFPFPALSLFVSELEIGVSFFVQSYFECVVFPKKYFFEYLRSHHSLYGGCLI